MKISLTPLDKLFSKYIRLRDKTCQRCGSSHGLQCCHFHSRRYKILRWNPDNAVCLCFGCHAYLDSHPYEKIEFFKKRLGEEKLDYLQAQLRVRDKPDINLITLYIQKLLKELGVK